MNVRLLTLKMYCLLFLALGATALSAAEKQPMVEMADLAESSYDSDTEAVSIAEDPDTSETVDSSNVASSSAAPDKTPKKEVWCFKIKGEYKSLVTTQNAIETCIFKLKQLFTDHKDVFHYLFNLLIDNTSNYIRITRNTGNEPQIIDLLNKSPYEFLQKVTTRDVNQPLTIKDLTPLTVYVYKTAVSRTCVLQANYQTLSKTRKICPYNEVMKLIQIYADNKQFNELYPNPSNAEESLFIFKDQGGFQTTLKTTREKIEKMHDAFSSLSTQEMICFEKFTASYPNITFDKDPKKGQVIDPIVLQQLIDKGLIFENSEQRAKKKLRAFIKANPDVHQLLQKNNIMPLINNFISDEKLTIEKSDIKTLIITPLAQCVHDAAALVTGGLTPLKKLYADGKIIQVHMSTASTL